jgi:hypothetical protein
MCGRSTPGWRWLDLRGLFADVIATHSQWTGAVIENVTYCTARIGGPGSQVSVHEQDVYLRALVYTGSASVIAYGNYVSRVATAPLARRNSRGKPMLTHPDWPIMVRDASGAENPDATFMASVARREEKGSDVNVASHLLIDVLTGAVDAAVVVSNDSDLAYPLSFARTRVPVGTLNPTKGFLAGQLAGMPGDGVGNHWWYGLKAADLCAHQLPNAVAPHIVKPAPW